MNFKAISKKYSSVYICRYLYFYYIIQIIVALIIVLVDNNYLVPGSHIYPIKVSDVLIRISVIITIIGFVIRTALRISSYNAKIDNNKGLLTRALSIGTDYNINILSTALLVIFTLSILFTLIPNFPYALRVITLSFDFLPLFIGIFFLQFTRSKRVWCILLFSLNSLLNLVQGSRGLAIIPVGLLCIGYLISISDFKRRFRRTLFIFMLIGMPAMSIFGMIQDFREQYGRGNVVTVENIKLMLTYLFEGGGKSVDKDSYILLGLSRFLNIGDMAVITLTPRVVDYRLFDDMDKELGYIYKLYGGEGGQEFREQRGSLNYGSGVLSKYGFSVNENTSVGLGLLGDSYSRFGICGVLVYFFFITLLLTSAEIKLLHDKKNRLLAFTFLLFLIYTSLYTLYGNSYFVLFKKFLYNGLLVYVCLSVLCRKNVVTNSYS